MTSPTNFLVQVQTWQMAGMLFLGNYGVFIHESNKMFQNFQEKEANLGDTVTYELTPRFASQEGLVVNYQPIQQRVETMTCDNGWNVSFNMTNQQMLFNLDEYLPRAVKGAVEELATTVEADVATLAETSPYRFYGNGVTPIDSYKQLAKALAFFRNYGAPKDTLKVILSDLVEPDIVGSGLNEYATERNNEIANSWVVGKWMGVEYFRSNLLPTHYAGTVGNENTTLTVISTNDPTGNNITQITFSGAATSDKPADRIRRHRLG